jgi:Rrf2 family protein
MLSKKTKYAFHALTYLAENQGKGAILIQEIAEKKNISHKFLENILLDLRKSGILGSKKGKGGGYYLIKSPEEISLAKVIRLLDGPIAMLPCVSLYYYERCADCENEATCGLHNIMIQVRDQTLNVLENKTLKDIMNT